MTSVTLAMTSGKAHAGPAMTQLMLQLQEGMVANADVSSVPGKPVKITSHSFFFTHVYDYNLRTSSKREEKSDYDDVD